MLGGEELREKEKGLMDMDNKECGDCRVEEGIGGSNSNGKNI